MLGKVKGYHLEIGVLHFIHVNNAWALIPEGAVIEDCGIFDS